MNPKIQPYMTIFYLLKAAITATTYQQWPIFWGSKLWFLYQDLTVLPVIRSNIREINRFDPYNSSNTVKLVQMTTFEFRPPVYNGFNEKVPFPYYFRVPRVVVVHRVDCIYSTYTFTFIVSGHHDVEVLRVWDGLVQQEVDDPVVHLPGLIVRVVHLNIKVQSNTCFFG